MKAECPHCGKEISIKVGAADDLPPNGIKVRPAVRLSVIEKAIVEHGIMKRAPSRQTLIRMIERGDFDGRMIGGSWAVYEDSFWQWAGQDSVPLAA